MQPTRFALPLIVALLTCSSSLPALADPGPEGPAFPAEDRPLPSKGWWQRCTWPDGSSAGVRVTCLSEGCKTAELTVDVLDADGKPAGASTTINDVLARGWAARPGCSPTGRFVVQWIDAQNDCFHHRVFERDGRPVGDNVDSIPDGGDCTVRPNLAVENSGAFTAVWIQKGSDSSTVVARRFANDGRPAAAPFEVSEPSAADRSFTPKVASDAAGNALVVWIGRGEGATSSPIYVRFLRDGAALVGSPFRIDPFDAGVNATPAIVAEDRGRFLVLWSNMLFGGRLGRRVALDPEPTPAPPTVPVVEPPSDFPRFGVVRTIDASAASVAERFPYTIHEGSGSTWIVAKERGSFWRTTDDGSAWEPALWSDTYTRLGEVGLATDEAGTWLAIEAAEKSGEIFYRRSDDDGGSWTESLPLATVTDGNFGCNGCGIVRTGVAADRSGVWVVALSMLGAADHESIYVARSRDHGATWGTPELLARGRGTGISGLDLVTDGHGVWVLAMADNDVLMMRSVDDGKTWSQPHTIVSHIVCADCAKHRRYGRVELACDGRGTWLAAFASPTYGTDRYGLDADVFVVRSRDDGARWAAPVAVASYAASDGARDADPTIATDGSGRWLVAWTSHQPLDGPSDMDADVFLAMSTDAGTSWSQPVKLNHDATDDLTDDPRLDSNPRLAADTRGIWMALWQSRSFAASTGTGGDRLLVAAADGECGNALVEVAEQCDDGNFIDGDGCDFNCTRTGCGNGIVTGNERCDDGNRRDTDACPNDCFEAVCGDGLTRHGVEECDYNDPDPAVARICSDQCKILDICGDTDGDDVTSVRDAQRILRTAVGINGVCPADTCDTDGNGLIGAHDAQLALDKAVGIDELEHCLIVTGRMVFWLGPTGPIGALQFDADYSGADGTFIGTDENVACDFGGIGNPDASALPVAPETPLVAANNCSGTPCERPGQPTIPAYTLSMGFATTKSFHGPLELARCAFDIGPDAAQSVLDIRTTDASDLNGNPIWPPPRIGYALLRGSELVAGTLPGDGTADLLGDGTSGSIGDGD